MRLAPWREWYFFSALQDRICILLLFRLFFQVPKRGSSVHLWYRSTYCYYFSFSLKYQYMKISVHFIIWDLHFITASPLPWGAIIFLFDYTWSAYCYSFFLEVPIRGSSVHFIITMWSAYRCCFFELSIHDMDLNMRIISDFLSLKPSWYIVRFTLNSSTRIIEFRGFLSQFSTNFYEILHTLFSIHVVTTLKISRNFDKYFRS